MLSVLHVLTSLNLGGAEKFTLELARYQRAQGIDAQLLSLGLPTDFLSISARDADIPVTVSESDKGRLTRLRQIRGLFSKFDVVQIHSPRALSFIAPVLLLPSRGKIVYTRHGLDPLNTLTWRMLHKILSPKIDHITFVTQSGYDVFEANHHWNPEKMHVIENGVPIPEKHVSSQGSKIRFGSVGRMVGLKGQRFLLGAVGELLRDSPEIGDCLKLNFFGSGPLETELQDQASQLSGADIQFHGEEHDIDKIYNAIDVLVVASETEGLSMVIIEAMARAIPVIATNVGGNTTLVKDQLSGIVVPYGDSELLAKAMKQLLEKPTFIDEYGKEARKFISGNYSIGKTASRYLSYY